MSIVEIVLLIIAFLGGSFIIAMIGFRLAETNCPIFLIVLIEIVLAVIFAAALINAAFWLADQPMNVLPWWP